MSTVNQPLLNNLQIEVIVDRCWYPTIFFHDLEKRRIVWEIYGAEQFISINAGRKVSVLTCKIWTDQTKEEYDGLIEG